MEYRFPMPCYGGEQLPVNQVAISQDGTVASTSDLKGKVALRDFDV